MPDKIVCILPSKHSFDWLTPFLQFMIQSNISVVGFIVNEEQTISKLPNLAFRTTLMFEFWLLRKKVKETVKVEGFNFMEICLQNGIQLIKVWKNLSDHLVFNFSGLRIPGADFNIYFSGKNWASSWNQIIIPCLMEWPKTDVVLHLSQDDQPVLASEIKTELTFVRQLQRYFFRYALDCWYAMDNQLLSRLTSTTVQSMPFLNLKWIRHYLRFLVRRKPQSRWKLFLFENNSAIELKNQTFPVTADPFVIEWQDETYIFFEEMEHGRNGKISAARLSDRELVEKQVVLEDNFHFSYPHVFRIGMRHFMLPETGASGHLRLYEVEEFPYIWKFRRNILSGLQVYDPTPFEHMGIWWLFATIKFNNLHSSNEDLFLFYTKDLLSEELKLHPANPIKRTVIGSRSAGKIYKEGNTLIRPAQDCSGHYGRRIALFEIKHLSPTVYAEKFIRFIEPPQPFLGMHTINSCSNYTIVDCLEPGRYKIYWM